MIISLIAAMAENRVIGRDDRLPWHLPKDLKRFRALTMGHPVIMGRKTYESIGHALTGRTNIVVTSRQGYQAAGCVVVPNLAAAFSTAEGADEVFVLGGARLFRDTLPIADRIYLTIVRERTAGDVLFPEIPEEFVLVERVPVQDALPLELLRYERCVG